MFCLNSNSPSPSGCGSPPAWDFKSINFTFSCELDFPCVQEQGVRFSLQVPFWLSPREAASLLIYQFQVSFIEYVSSVDFFTRFCFCTVSHEIFSVCLWVADIIFLQRSNQNIPSRYFFFFLPRHFTTLSLPRAYQCREDINLFFVLNYVCI